MNASIIKKQVILIIGTVSIFCLLSSLKNIHADHLDIRPFGVLSYWSDQTGVLGKNIEESDEISVPKTSDSEWNVGVWWNEERDVNKLVVNYSGKVSEALYGPMILITTGIIDPLSPLAEAILDDWEDNITLSSSLGQHIHGIVDDEYWFSRGGMVFQANLQNPIQAYMLRNEIPAAVRNLYNAMVSCLYRDVNAFTEEYRRWGGGSGRLYKVPDEARFLSRVCDLLAIESGDELWLAPGTPRYWLEPGKTISLYHAATSFGNVSFELRSGKKPNTVEATINLPENIPEDKVKLFVRSPFGKPIQSVLVNGKGWAKWDSTTESVVLPTHDKEIIVIVSY